MSISYRTPIGADIIQRPVQPKTCHAFRRKPDITTAGNGLADGPGTSACGRADRSALTASGDRADDRADYCSASDIFSGAPVGSDTFFSTLYRYIFRAAFNRKAL